VKRLVVSTSGIVNTPMWTEFPVQQPRVVATESAVDLAGLRLPTLGVAAPGRKVVMHLQELLETKVSYKRTIFAPAIEPLPDNLICCFYVFQMAVTSDTESFDVASTVPSIGPYSFRS